MKEWLKQFFSLQEPYWKVPIEWKHVIGAFSIYFSINLIFPLLYSFILQSIINNKIALPLDLKKSILSVLQNLSFLNFTALFLVLIALLMFSSTIFQKVRSDIIRRKEYTFSWMQDLKEAIQTWLIAFPVVVVISAVFEQLMKLIFKMEELPDQIAVKFLKSTFENPISFFLAIISIMILAPLVEETLFRGFLQSFIRQKVGPKLAIIVTSFCFACFHFSIGQGIGNIVIIFSLFLFSLFIGFLYEKRGSLLAPMILHSIFNTVSIINLYLFNIE